VKLLVTGGAGYIGGIVTALLLEAGHDVTVLDDCSTGHADAVPSGATFVQGGVDSAGDVLDPSYDGVLHFAAKSLVAESVARPDLYWRSNVGGSLALLDAMRAHGVRRIVFSSTAATYGEPATMPITEDTPPVPTNPYGASKLAVDRMLEGEARAYDVAAVSLRYFNVAGAYGGLGERHDPETHLIPNLLAVAAGEVEQAKVFGTDYPTRDGTAGHSTPPHPAATWCATWGPARVRPSRRSSTRYAGSRNGRSRSPRTHAGQAIHQRWWRRTNGQDVSSAGLRNAILTRWSVTPGRSVRGGRRRPRGT
jgi:hypothetical protein